LFAQIQIAKLPSTAFTRVAQCSTQHWAVWKSRLSVRTMCRDIPWRLEDARYVCGSSRAVSFTPIIFV
jgi:hypothetical protein